MVVSCCFYLSCWAFLFAAFFDRNLPEPILVSGVNCQVSSCQHPESAGTHRLMLVPRRLGLHSAGGLWERFGCSHSLGRTGWGAHVIFFVFHYCPLLMDKKSCTTWDGAKTLYIMGKNYWPQQVTAGFLIHQQYETKMSSCFFSVCEYRFPTSSSLFCMLHKLGALGDQSHEKNVTVIMRLSGVIDMKPIGSRYMFTWSCNYHKNLRYFILLILSTSSGVNMVWNILKSPLFNLYANTSWWFQRIFIFTPTWGNDPIWQILLRWVETTN